MRAAVFLLSIGCAPDATFDLLPGRDGGTSDVASEAIVDTSCGSCPCGTTSCGATCVDLKRDPDNCGMCGKTCAHNQYCHQGQCECWPGLTVCQMSCLDFASNPDHCGACNATPCQPGEKCENGTCGNGTCANGKLSCDFNGRTGCETPNLFVCLGCNIACSPNEICTPSGCKKYKPATPCTSCPCSCGQNAICCNAIDGAICVEGSVCP